MPEKVNVERAAVGGATAIVPLILTLSRSIIPVPFWAFQQYILKVTAEVALVIEPAVQFVYLNMVIWCTFPPVPLRAYKAYM